MSSGATEVTLPALIHETMQLGQCRFLKMSLLPGLGVICAKINKGSLAFHQLTYNGLPIKVISCWLEFYFSLNHFPLLVLDPAVMCIFYKLQVETRNKNKMWRFIEFYLFHPFVLRTCGLQEKPIKIDNWGECWFWALLALFLVKKMGFSLDAVVWFSTENSGMDGHSHRRYTFLLNI